MSKKKDKDIEHATYVWEREQLQAAAMMEQIDKSLAVVEHHKDEVTDTQLIEIYEQVKSRRSDVAEFLLKARDKYVTKCRELGVEPLVPEEA